MDATEFQDLLSQDPEWKGYEGLSPDLAKPHGHQKVITESRPDDLSYLPEAPKKTGVHLYMAPVYPLLDFRKSLWEHYHAQSDIDLKPETYITPVSPARLASTEFHTLPDARRLHWHENVASVKDFLDFLRTLVITNETKRTAWALAYYETTIKWPNDSLVAEDISCVFVLPYNQQGMFVPDQRQSASQRQISWCPSDLVMEQQVWRNGRNELRLKHEAEQRETAPVDDMEFRYNKAEDIAIAVQMMGSV